MSAKASGADSSANGAASHRGPSSTSTPGKQDRNYTVEQKAAVIRIRRCGNNDFYEILGIERTVTDGEIKKAYRKLSLLTHPDKNGYDGADEAFKMVSRAFQILSDADKKAQYDRYGGDPDSRFGAAQASSPFSGFARSPGAARGPMFDDEISPEELFQRFFGGGMAGGMGGPFGAFGGDMFGGGQPFVFNLGGGPGFRVHQFGGGRPRRRPRDANGGADEPQNFWSLLASLLPILILFVLPLLSSLFSGSDSGAYSGPEVKWEYEPPYTQVRVTPRWRLNYFANPADIRDYSQRKLHTMDQRVELKYINSLQYACQGEMQTQNRMLQEAQGWFFPDADKMREARNLEMRSCNRLRSLGIALNSY